MKLLIITELTLASLGLFVSICQANYNVSTTALMAGAAATAIGIGYLLQPKRVEKIVPIDTQVVSPHVSTDEEEEDTSMIVKTGSGITNQWTSSSAAPLPHHEHSHVFESPLEQQPSAHQQQQGDAEHPEEFLDQSEEFFELPKEFIGEPEKVTMQQQEANQHQIFDASNDHHDLSAVAPGDEQHSQALEVSDESDEDVPIMPQSYWQQEYNRLMGLYGADINKMTSVWAKHSLGLASIHYRISGMMPFVKLVLQPSTPMHPISLQDRVGWLNHLEPRIKDWRAEGSPIFIYYN